MNQEIPQRTAKSLYISSRSNTRQAEIVGNMSPKHLSTVLEETTFKDSANSNKVEFLPPYLMESTSEIKEEDQDDAS